MGAFTLEIPEDVLEHVRIRPSELEDTLRTELAVQLYARSLLPKAAARRLSGKERLEFDDLLGKRGIHSELTEEDFELEMSHLAALRGSIGR